MLASLDAAEDAANGALDVARIVAMESRAVCASDLHPFFCRLPPGWHVVGLTLSSHAEFCGALRTASSIVLSAYVLQARSDVLGELERAGDRGANVEVTLDGLATGTPAGARMAGAALAAELRAHRVRVNVPSPQGPFIHMKAALVDGIAYLDDRNWPATGHDTLVRTDSDGDVAVVASALAGRPAANGRIATEKSAALSLEAAVIRNAPGDRVDVESESFGGSAISAALRERASAGASVRLIVARRELDLASHGRERSLLAKLALAGVAVRASSDAEKLCATPGRAWIGSANATYAGVATTDWGLSTQDPALVAGVARAFERNWASAQPVLPAGFKAERYAPRSSSAVARVRSTTSATPMPSSLATKAAVSAR